MKNLSKEMFDKTKEVLFCDKLKTPNKMGGILSSELCFVLSQYFDINKHSFNARLTVQKNGELDITLSFKASRILIKKETNIS